MSASRNSVIAPKVVVFPDRDKNPNVVVAHPDKTPDEIKVYRGNTLEFRNEFYEFPDFEIEFSNCAPPCGTDTLTGSVDNPILIHMPDENKKFCYNILYKRRDGTCGFRQELRMAHTCGPC